MYCSVIEICNNDTEYRHAALTEAPAHLYVASNELRSPSEHLEFRFSIGLFTV